MPPQPAIAALSLPLVLTLPWVAVLLFALVGVRLPRTLPPEPDPAVGDVHGDGGSADGPLPRVSVVVPARNEEESVRACVASLAASRYPDFEILVVDDRSRDRTAELARSVAAGNARRLEVMEGEPLPEGWLGKPWACWQGAEEARGTLLLFTDADTVHGPDLLGRAVRALDEDAAAAVTVTGRQILGGFWEKVVQPQIFTLLGFRFPRLRRPVEPGECRRAIANGQFILLRREAYDDVGGHRALRGEVVEDLRLAQRLCRAGHRLSVREAEDALATRMYRSLAQMVEGWSKNLAIGALQTLPTGLRPVALPAIFLVGVGLWLLPPAVLAASLLLSGLPLLEVADVRLWSGSVVAVSALFWAGAARQMRIAPAWGLLYPLGSAVGAYVFGRSWLRGRTVEWKGRTYRVQRSILEEE